MEKNFKLTKLDNRKLKNLRLACIFAWILFTIGFIVTEKYEWKVNPFIILNVMTLTLFLLAQLIYRRFKFIGNLTLSSNRIQIQEKDKEELNFPIENISKLEIIFRGAKGENFTEGLGGVAAVGHKDGSGNKLSFYHLDNLNEFEFFSDKSVDYNALKIILTELSKKGIEVSLKRVNNR